MAVLKDGEDGSGVKRRGIYQKYSGARIGNYAVTHGSTAALNHFIAEFPGLKYTTICEWRKAIIDMSGKDPEHKPITELPDQKRGRPSTLPDEILSILKKYIYAVRDAGGIINASIVIAAGLGIVSQSRNIGVQWRVCCFKKSWAKYLLTKMNFVKCKATTKKPKFSVSNFEELKSHGYNGISNHGGDS